MITRAYLAQRESGQYGHEERLVAAVLEARGLPYKPYTLKRIHRRQLPLRPDTLVVGDMDCVHGALKQLGIELPEAESYPTSIRDHLHRQVWQTTLGAVAERFAHGAAAPVFVKPRGRQKCFTGFICDSEHSLSRAGGVSRHEPVYCSELVAWQSEYRVYVVEGQIRAIDHYDGDAGFKLDESVAEEAVAALHAAGQAYAGFGIDFGVLSNGQTALVEMNDGFALGAYDITGGDYTDLLIARWEELTGPPS